MTLLMKCSAIQISEMPCCWRVAQNSRLAVKRVSMLQKASETQMAPRFHSTQFSLLVPAAVGKTPVAVLKDHRRVQAKCLLRRTFKVVELLHNVHQRTQRRSVL